MAMGRNRCCHRPKVEVSRTFQPFRGCGSGGTQIPFSAKRHAQLWPRLGRHPQGKYLTALTSVNAHRSQLLILEIDLEGSEFATLVSIIADSQDRPLPFGQLLLEVHIGWSEGMDRPAIQMKRHHNRIKFKSRYDHGGPFQPVVRQTRAGGTSAVLLRGQHDGCEYAARGASSRLRESGKLTVRRG